MQTAAQPAPVSKTKHWTGHVISALAALFLLVDGGIKFTKLPQVAEAFIRLGYPMNLAAPIGVLELACAVLYAIPRTSVLGAVLLTGFLGGATATHVRAGTPFLFPVILGVLVWAGLFLRSERLRALVPVRSANQAGSVSKKMLWAGYILSALPALLLLFSAVMKLTKAAPVMESFAHFGYPAGVILAIGILELACTLIYIVPRTSVFGAILLAAYLGGAATTHLRVGEPFLPPIILGMVAWAGLYLREQRLRALLPLTKG